MSESKKTGRIFFREWRVFWSLEEKSPVLVSVFMPFVWEHASATADRLPEKEWGGSLQLGMLHGLHALDPLSLPDDPMRFPSFLTHPRNERGPKLVAQGAVLGSRPDKPTGRIVYHEDGIVRCEHMRVLALRVGWVPGPQPCEHKDIVMAAPTNTRIEDKYVAFGPCVCHQSLETVYVAAYLSGVLDVAPELLFKDKNNAPLARFTPAQLEDLLCQRYEVPHLPLGVGPWEPPWGKGAKAARREAYAF